MHSFTVEGREYRTDGRKSPISGRLLIVESRRDDGTWRAVRNVSTRERILNLLEGQPEPCKHPTKISSCGIKVCMDCGAPLNRSARNLAGAL